MLARGSACWAARAFAHRQPDAKDDVPAAESLRAPDRVSTPHLALPPSVVSFATKATGNLHEGKVRTET